MGKAYRYAIVNMHEGKRELSQYSVVESITVFDRELSGAELDAWPDYLILDDGLGLAVGDGYDGHTWTRNIDGAQVSLPIDEPSRAVDAMLSLLHGLPVQGEDMGASQLGRVEKLRETMQVAGDIVAEKGDDADVLRCADIYPEWGAGAAYKMGAVIRHGETLYRIQQAVTAQAHQQPGGAGMLAVYAPVQVQSEEDQEAGKVLPWVNGETGLQVGDRREYKNTVYEAIQSPGANIWTPDAVPAIWKKVA